MKIGKDEVGPVGLAGLILVLPGAFLTSYGLLAPAAGVLCPVGLVMLVLAFVLCGFDVSRHRKARRRA